jgi:hypothetical protein
MQKRQCQKTNALHDCHAETESQDKLKFALEVVKMQRQDITELSTLVE